MNTLFELLSVPLVLLLALRAKPRTPPALRGAVLMTLRLVCSPHAVVPGDMTWGYWGRGYFGGAAAALGGALLYGALPRLMRAPRVGVALTIGVGLALLANSRPFEGLAVSLP